MLICGVEQNVKERIRLSVSEHSEVRQMRGYDTRIRKIEQAVGGRVPEFIVIDRDAIPAKREAYKKEHPGKPLPIFLVIKGRRSRPASSGLEE